MFCPSAVKSSPAMAKTLLAASEPTSIVGIKAELLPQGQGKNKIYQRNKVFMYLSSVLPFTDTLTISPTTVLRTNPAFATSVYELINILPADTSFEPGHGITLTVPPGRSLTALELSRAYSDVVTLYPGAEAKLKKVDLPPYLVVPIATDIPREVALALRENSAILPGVRVIEGFRRAYPLSTAIPSLSHLLGYTGRINEEQLAELNPADQTQGAKNYLPNDIIGHDGLEAQYEDVLRGVLGTNYINVDVFQRTVGEPTVVRSMVNGQNLILNIDLDLQRASEEILTKWLRVADNRRQQLGTLNTADGQRIAQYPPITNGVIMAMNVKTGAVLASVSLPNYDNNVWYNFTDADAERLFEDSTRPLFHRAIAGAYPPGSTFKQFTAAAGLKYGVITPETRFFDPGFLILKNEYHENLFNRYPNSGSTANGLINVSDALMVSSNVFFHIVGGGTHYVTNFRPEDPQLPEGVGIADFYTMLVDEFGFNQRTGIDLPGESKGQIPNSEWKKKILKQTWASATPTSPRSARETLTSPRCNSSTARSRRPTGARSISPRWSKRSPAWMAPGC
jgi:penicillin-binding protein 2